MMEIINQYGMEWLPFLTSCTCVLPIVWFVIAILIAVWVYRDAESRGMEGALWLIICFIAGIFGLIIYLVVRKDKVSAGAGTMPSMGPIVQYCKHCGAPLSPGSRFCPKCGKEQG